MGGREPRFRWGVNLADRGALTRIEMRDLIERVWRDKGFTAIVVTRDVTEALALADRVLLIEDAASRWMSRSIRRVRADAAIRTRGPGTRVYVSGRDEQE
jgi:sulfonate transport system ATP-binding protein